MNVYKPEGMIKQRSVDYNENELISAKEKGTILEAPAIKSDENLTLYINLGKSIYGLIPYEECEVTEEGKVTKSIAVISKVGKYVAFKVKEIRVDESGNKYAILSRKDAQSECIKQFISELKLGDIIDAKVTHLESYGVFCDIGCGITALLPIKNLCIARITDLKTALRTKKFLKVIVSNIQGSRITLSHKELLGTWEEEIAKYNIGQTVMGIVRSMDNHGVFVELTPNLSGLADATNDLKPGYKVSAFIKNIIPEQMKVRLLIINSEPTDNEIEAGMEFDYKISEGRVRHWKYSPEESTKIVETIFYEE